MKMGDLSHAVVEWQHTSVFSFAIPDGSPCLTKEGEAGIVLRCAPWRQLHDAGVFIIEVLRATSDKEA